MADTLYYLFFLSICFFIFFFFFFQAEDGIRDGRVTGVQTCALPILQVPWVTTVADPQAMGGLATRTSYVAAWPAPSSTSVKASVTELVDCVCTARSVTVPGAPGAAVSVTTVR